MKIQLETHTVATPQGMARCVECHTNLELGARVVIANHRHDLPFCSGSCATAEEA